MFHLYCRLKFYEQNDANATTSNEAEKVMLTPPMSTYKDLHGGMKDDFPAVTQERLDDYLSLFDKQFEELLLSEVIFRTSVQLNFQVFYLQLCNNCSLTLTYRYILGYKPESILRYILISHGKSFQF
jgi:hypothetical protein